ncbi:MAG: hypothetical protein ACSLFQ_00355, partial [Thermoanaerobaculia bacterium]
MTTRFMTLALCALLLFVPVASGATVGEILAEFPISFDWLNADSFAGVPGVPDAYEAHFTVGSQSFDAYVYSAESSPTVAITLQKVPEQLADLTALFGIEIDSPVLFWSKDGGELSLAAMPANLKSYVEQKTGMADGVRTLAGVNLFGRFSGSSSLAALNLPKLCLGFARKDATSLVTMALPAGSSWSQPFHMPNTTVKSGVVHIERAGGDVPQTSVEAWATVSLKGASNDFTMAATHDGTRLQAAAFDTASASLKDVVAVLGAFGNVLTLPTIPTPPDDAVTLKNDRYQPYVDSARPDIEKMMFQAALTNDADASVYVNAKGEIFGVTVAEMRLSASSSGVRLSVPASCPLRPVGLTVDLTQIRPDHMPVTSELKDCFSGAIVDLAKAAAEVSTEAAKFTADAATKAGRVGEQAAADTAEFTADRFKKWEHAMGTAVAGPAALKAANDTVARLDKAIRDLGTTITGLEHDIENLLSQAWTLVTGQVAKKKEAKTDAIAARNEARTELADANHRVEEAGKALGVAAANLQGDLADVTHQLQAATAQQTIMESVKRYAENLTAQKILEQTGDLIRTGKVDPAIGFSASVTDLKTAAEAWSALPQVQLTQAVTALVEAETERQLQKQIPKLPTMSFDIPVWITNYSELFHVDEAGLLRARSASVRDGSEVFVF